jgi:hypothetical protein
VAGASSKGRRYRRTMLVLLGLLALLLPGARATAVPSRSSAEPRTLSERIQLEVDRTGRNWGFVLLSAEEAKRLDMEASGSGQHTTNGQAVSASSVAPRDATKCASDVCLIVKSQGGSGPVITFWETNAKQYSYDGLICGPKASFRRNGNIERLIDISDTICRRVQPNQIGVWYIRRTDLPRRYTPGDQLCNAWSPRNFVGYPCARVGG